LWWWWKNRKPKNEPIILKNVNFDFNTANLRPESETELNKLAEILKNNINTSVNIVGHTDSVGSDAYNLNLSKQRAEAVVNYLINKGIDGKRLISIGKGESEPIATNDTEDGRAINRRVEYIINSEIKL
jgi:outer membrane protein OmpA-like peptidoglycan-associated protein